MSCNHTEDRMSFTGDATRTMPEDALRAPYYRLGCGLSRSLVAIHSGQCRVAFLGGSITAMPGWRAMVCDDLEAQFPDTQFDFIDAGIGGTNSTYGTFRFERDVCCHGCVDLLFLEFAVNDSRRTGKPGNELRTKAFEGIIRQAIALNPQIDIIVQYLCDASKVEAYAQGMEPGPITDHEAVVRHYDLPVINQATAVIAGLNAKEFVWKEFSCDSCHPAPFGHNRYVREIKTLLAEAWGADALPIAVAMTLPPPLHCDHLGRVRLVSSSEAAIKSGWEFVKGWEAEKVCNYSGPVDVFTAKTAGAELEFAFNGSMLALSAIAGMDAGTLEIILDGGPHTFFDLFDEHCPKFHRPVFPVLLSGLPEGGHTVHIRLAAESNPESAGTAARILAFGVKR